MVLLLQLQHSQICIYYKPVAQVKQTKLCLTEYMNFDFIKEKIK
jgi:hypothetical protein